MKISRATFLRVACGSALAALLGRASKSTLATESQPPATPSAPRWGMAIDYARCPAECNKCALACHAAHNVPSVSNPLHTVKWIWKSAYEKLFPNQSSPYTEPATAGALLPVLCNHCASPACVRVCPTQATWKRNDGVVMMDYHRCIGCRYCMAACPYGSRSFNWEDPRPHLAALNPQFPTRARGVVEKCNFCEERLAIGLAPACVTACPQNAILFGDLNDPHSALRRTLQTRRFQQRRPELGSGPAIFYLT